MIEEPKLDPPVRIKAAGGMPWIILREIGAAIDYVDTLLDRDGIGHRDLLTAAKADLHAANEAPLIQRDAAMVKARKSLRKASGIRLNVSICRRELSPDTIQPQPPATAQNQFHYLRPLAGFGHAMGLSAANRERRPPAHRE
jgi:hypothetical protein